MVGSPLNAQAADTSSDCEVGGFALRRAEARVPEKAVSILHRTPGVRSSDSHQ